MFTLVQISPERSDCTMDLAVLFDETMTVEEFIVTVLKEYPYDWGHFKILNWLRDNPWSETIDNSVLCHYKKGCMEEMFPDEILNKKVIWAKASAGETNINYYLLLEGGRIK